MGKKKKKLLIIIPDDLNKLVAKVSTAGTEEGIDINAEMRRVAGVMEGKAAAGKELTLDDVGLDKRILGTLTEYEEHRLLYNLKKNRNLFRVEARFPFDSFDEDLNGLTEELKGMGEIVSTLPSSDESSPETLNFDLVVGTELTHEKVQEGISKKDGITVHPVDYARQEAAAAPKAKSKAKPKTKSGSRRSKG